MNLQDKDNKNCPRIQGVCPHLKKKPLNKRTCFVMMAYEEKCSPDIESMLKKAIINVLKVEPVLAKDVKSLGGDMFCITVCKEIIESEYCIVDITYKNTNVGIEYAVAQYSFNKPVVITQYAPKKTKGSRIGLEENEKMVLEKLKKRGLIQYCTLPLTTSDLIGISYIKYSDEQELEEGLRKATEVKTY